MKIAEIDRILSGIAAIQGGGESVNVKLAYALAKNRRALAQAREEYVETVKGPFDEVLQAFDKDKFDLVRQHAVKDQFGNPVSEAGLFKFQPGFDIEAALTQIKAKHPAFDDAIAERDARLKDAAQIEFDVALHKIGWDDLPTQINPAILDAIVPLISDDGAPASAAAA
jgi:hypothetical protein